jgi:hypothetical protein
LGGAAVGQVVAVDAGDHEVFEAHFFGHLGDSCRLGGVRRRGSAGGDGAEPAIARADIAEYQDGYGSPRPALASIGAVCAAADCLEVERVQDLLGAAEGVAGG